jgi:hypothetical protein
MLSKTTTVIIFCFIIFGFNGCEKKDKKHNTVPKVETKATDAVVSSDAPSEKSGTSLETPTIKSSKVKSSETKIAEKKPAEKKNVSVPKNYKIYSNLKKLLNTIGLGETKTKQQLIDSKVVPEDALQIVKSVTKVSENELAIAWKSTWLVEKVSDVKLKDDKIKVAFKNGLVYTSGNAIGIKYDGEIYHDLIIKGDRAYIPSVKEYNWKIGKK